MKFVNYLLFEIMNERLLVGLYFAYVVFKYQTYRGFCLIIKNIYDDIV